VVINPTLVFLKQMWALVAAATRELLWGLRAVSREVEHWQARASAIPDAAIREDALASLAHKRPNADGAALFWTVPERRNVRLLRTLVVYETMADFLDSANERGAGVGMANGRQLHLAFVEAIDPDVGLSEHYRHHPWHDDMGYLRGLVSTCREHCATLPSHAAVRAQLVSAAALAQVQCLRHELDIARRDAALREWAEKLTLQGRELSWFELAGAASAWLTVLALIALAACPNYLDDEAAATYAAYFPWIALTATMLDGYADMAEDAAIGTDSYVVHYCTREEATDRAQELARRSALVARSLHAGHRHHVIVACMIAMYLSKDSARTPELRPTTRQIARAGGGLTRLLVPILRAWRIANGQRNA
jgi:tetraprenyl-beta-curcumene synthase